MCQASNLNGIWRNKFIQMNNPSSVLTCDQALLALHMHPSCALSTKTKQNKVPDNRLVCMSVQKETAAYMQAIFFDPILLTTAKLGTDFQLPISSYRVVTYVWGSNPSTLCPDCTEICAMYARMKQYFFFFNQNSTLKMTGDWFFEFTIDVTLQKGPHAAVGTPSHRQFNARRVGRGCTSRFRYLILPVPASSAVVPAYFGSWKSSRDNFAKTVLFLLVPATLSSPLPALSFSRLVDALNIFQALFAQL